MPALSSIVRLRKLLVGGEAINTHRSPAQVSASHCLPSASSAPAQQRACPLLPPAAPSSGRGFDWPLEWESLASFGALGAEESCFQLIPSFAWRALQAASRSKCCYTERLSQHRFPGELDGDLMALPRSGSAESLYKIKGVL